MQTSIIHILISLFFGFFLVTTTVQSGSSHNNGHSHDHGHKDMHKDEHQHGHDDNHNHAHQEGAHVHGLAELNVALEGEQLLIQLQSPAYNIVGFEHKAATQEEQRQLDHAMSQLHATETLFSLPSTAQCTIKNVKVHSPLLEKKTTDRLEHADIEAEYNYSCKSPEALTHLNVQLLAIFLLMEKITVQTVTSKGQSRVELSLEETRIQF